MIEQLVFNMESPAKRATDKYSKIMKELKDGKRIDQADRVFAMLFEASLKGVGVPLTDLLMIASHTARVSELRQEGFCIECKTWMVSSQKHSEYRLKL